METKKKNIYIYSILNGNNNVNFILNNLNNTHNQLKRKTVVICNIFNISLNVELIKYFAK